MKEETLTHNPATDRWERAVPLRYSLGLFERILHAFGRHVWVAECCVICERRR